MSSNSWDVYHNGLTWALPSVVRSTCPSRTYRASPVALGDGTYVYHTLTDPRKPPDSKRHHRTWGRASQIHDGFRASSQTSRLEIPSVVQRFIEPEAMHPRYIGNNGMALGAPSGCSSQGARHDSKLRAGAVMRVSKTLNGLVVQVNCERHLRYEYNKKSSAEVRAKKSTCG